METIVNQLKSKRNAIALKSFVCTGAVILASAMATSVSASGSFAPGSVGPQGKYNVGKVVFHKKISCSACPLPSKRLDKASASDLIKSLQSDSTENVYLKSSEKKAVIYYLKKRYRVK